MKLLPTTDLTDKYNDLSYGDPFIVRSLSESLQLEYDRLHAA